jgi:hypothetical protein
MVAPRNFEARKVPEKDRWSLFTYYPALVAGNYQVR